METSLGNGDSGLLKTIVEEGTLIKRDPFYYSKKFDTDGKIVRMTYEFEGATYNTIKKRCDIRNNSVEEQVRILIECQKMGFHTPTLHIDKDEYWHMFDITENEKHYLLDMGAGGAVRRIVELHDEDDIQYFFINDRKTCFENLSNFTELMSETPAKLARFRRFYRESYGDPFMYLIKNNIGLLYLIDVEDVRKEKPEMICNPKQSSYKNIDSVLNNEDSPLDDPILNIISKKPEIQSKMKKIFLEEFKKHI